MVSNVDFVFLLIITVDLCFMVNVIITSVIFVCI